MPGHRRLFRLKTRGSGDAERELREEIEAHIEMRIEDQVRRGVSERVAREEALRRFGDPEAAWADLGASVRRRERRLRLREAVDGVRRSLTLAVRQARRTPGFVGLSVLTLGLGVGLTTAAFTVMDHVLVRPLPYVQPNELIALFQQAEHESARITVAAENWIDWKERNRTLESLALHRSGSVSAGDESGARLVRMEEVTGDFFRVLRTPMVSGRGFTDDEAQAGELLAVVSASFWRSRFGDRTALPVDVRIDGRTRQVIGVVPDDQAFPAGVQVWLPTRYRRWGGPARNWINWHAVARLAAGTTIDMADADLDRIADQIRQEAPEGLYSWGVQVVPLQDAVVGDIRTSLQPLLASALFVLLIACANVAGMSLARTLSRGQEVAVHVALGAGRGRIVRQIVSEHLYLALAAGTVGVLIAWTGTRVLASTISDMVPRANEISMDGRVLVFGLGASVIAGLLASAIPAWHASGVTVQAALRGSRGAVGRGRTRAGAILVATEVAVALVLLAGGGLLIRSFRSLTSHDLGFRVEGVVAAEAILNSPEYNGDDYAERRIRYWEDAMQRVRALPGTQAVAVGNWVPTGSSARGFIDIPGWTEPEASAGYRTVSREYFDVLGIPLLKGRVFDERDQPGTQRVTVISQAMAERYWPGGDPIGQTVKATSMEAPFEGTAPPLTVIGVVANVRQFGFDSDPQDEMFTVYTQAPYLANSMTLMVHAPTVPEEDMAARMARPLAGVDPDIALSIASFEARVGAWVKERRFVMRGLAALATLALVLAATGIYGLLSFTVAQRTRELGIRAALGARRGRIIGLTMARAGWIFLPGAVMGGLAAYWLTRAMSSLLVDISPTDPLTYVVALAVLAIACAAAAFVPAWRAARTDPLIALRNQ